MVYIQNPDVHIGRHLSSEWCLQLVSATSIYTCYLYVYFMETIGRSVALSGNNFVDVVNMKINLFPEYIRNNPCFIATWTLPIKIYPSKNLFSNLERFLRVSYIFIFLFQLCVILIILIVHSIYLLYIVHIFREKILFYSILFYSILFYSILFYISKLLISVISQYKHVLYIRNENSAKTTSQQYFNSIIWRMCLSLRNYKHWESRISSPIL